MTDPAQSASPGERVLVLAPTGRDAPTTVEVLARAGIVGVPFHTLGGLLMDIERGAGALLIAQEALEEQGVQRLADALAAQPRWSELPVVLMTAARGSGHAWSRALDDFRASGMVTLLERPTSVEALVAVMAFALRSRRRQYVVRDLLERLDRQGEELRRSNEDLENFASIASHDLQEPLRIVTSYGTLLESRYGDKLDEAGRKSLRYMSDAAKRMRRMVASILEYSQASRSRVPPTPVDMGEAVREALQNLEQHIQRRAATVAVGPLPTVVGDVTQFALVFQNLIGNAIKYAEQQPLVRIEAREAPDEWVIDISDNGIGIRSEDRERIFKLFTRLPGPASELAGSGIGLATCKKIVERHGGRISVTSPSGGGSTFSVALPKPVG